MITRAQAEALLALAESLEACERVGLRCHVVVPGEQLNRKGVDFVSAVGLRHAIADQYKKPA